MRRVALSLSSVVALAALHSFTAPESADPTPTEFRKQLDAADRAFGEGSYLAAVERLRSGMQIAHDALRASVIEVMPAPPTGFVPVAMPDAPAPRPNDALAINLAVTSPRPIERRYQTHDGTGTLRILVAPNAPSVAFVQQQLRQAETDERFAAVVVGDTAGVIVRSAPTLAFRFALNGKHLLEIQTTGVEEEQLAKMVDQRSLERLITALGQ
jgi:hypothetical protein